MSLSASPEFVAQLAREARHICDLPEPGAWQLRAFGDCILAVNPNHQPRVIDKAGNVHILQAFPEIT